MKINMDQIPDSSGPPPPGEYECKCIEVKEDHNKDNWTLTWMVQTGPHAGKTFRDWLYLSERALPRIKILCKATGLPHQGEVDVQSGHFGGRIALVTAINEDVNNLDYLGGKTTKTSLKVPFGGYAAVPGATQPPLPAGDSYEPEQPDLPGTSEPDPFADVPI